MSATLRRTRSLNLGPVRLEVAVDERRAQQIAEHPLVRTARSLRNQRRAARPPPRPDAAGSPNGHGASGDSVWNRIRDVDWYHVIDLPGGIATPGRAGPPRRGGTYGLPPDMRGMRALEVATYDGFWAFEMERRGADVTAVDIASWADVNLPLRWREGMGSEPQPATGDGFRLAAELLGSGVTRRIVSVYELRPDELGLFDVVFMSDLIQHLRDPQLALERVFSVMKPGGVLILAEEYSHRLAQYAGQALMEFRSYQGYAVVDSVGRRPAVDVKRRGLR